MVAANLPTVADESRVLAQGIQDAAAKMHLPQADASQQEKLAYLEELRQVAVRVSCESDAERRTVEILNILEDFCWMATAANRLAAEFLKIDSALSSRLNGD